MTISTIAPTPSRAAHKTERIIMRVTPEQRQLFERAAQINNANLSQWAIQNLEDIAEDDLARETTFTYPAEVFDRIQETINEGMNDRVRELIEMGAQWK